MKMGSNLDIAQGKMGSNLGAPSEAPAQGKLDEG